MHGVLSLYTGISRDVAEVILPLVAAFGYYGFAVGVEEMGGNVEEKERNCVRIIVFCEYYSTKRGI